MLHFKPLVQALSLDKVLGEIMLINCKRPLKTPLDAGSTNELQQVAIAAVDLVDENVI
jgi:hypothetical protein